MATLALTGIAGGCLVSGQLITCVTKTTPTSQWVPRPFWAERYSSATTATIATTSWTARGHTLVQLRPTAAALAGQVDVQTPQRTTTLTASPGERLGVQAVMGGGWLAVTAVGIDEHYHILLFRETPSGWLRHTTLHQPTEPRLGTLLAWDDPDTLVAAGASSLYIYRALHGTWLLIQQYTSTTPLLALTIHQSYLYGLTTEGYWQRALWGEEEETLTTTNGSSSSGGGSSITVGSGHVVLAYPTGAGRVEVWHKGQVEAEWTGPTPHSHLGSSIVILNPHEIWVGSPGTVHRFRRHRQVWHPTAVIENPLAGWGTWLHAADLHEVWVGHDQGVERWCQV